MLHQKQKRIVKLLPKQSMIGNSKSKLPTRTTMLPAYRLFARAFSNKPTHSLTLVLLEMANYTICVP
jgi:hypothetical protein